MRFLQNIIFGNASDEVKHDEKQKILIFCGAGISAESGLKTFRDSDGLWENHNVEDVCNIRTFRKNKEIVFNFYNDRKVEILSAKPNSAHYELKNIQDKYGEDNVHIFTSNIDTLLEKAGCKNVFHVHGDITKMQCTDCDHTWHIHDSKYDLDAICSKCNSSMIKPAIVFFHEQAPGYQKLNLFFSSSGQVSGESIVPNIKLFVGTSFNVIRPYVFFPKRGYSILVDPKPNLGEHEDDFYSIIEDKATTGIVEAISIVDGLYRKN